MVEEFRFQYPSVALTRTHRGNPDLAAQYRGDANNLLYQLKNLMRFRNLGQLKMTRFFKDGTIITAWSIWGHDFVNIDVSNTSLIGVGFDQQCVITFINLPEAISPMRYPGEIHEGETEGIDYIKIYYTIDVSRCMGCKGEVWNLCDTDPTINPDCDQFRFVTDTIPSKEGDPDNHCIYSRVGCHAQLISHGVDEGGRYLLIKAFTEWSFVDPFAMFYSRSGLGYMILKGSIEDTLGNTICEVQSDPIRVDCCLKNANLRTIKLWDDSIYFGSRPFMIGESGNFYETPDVIRWQDLYAYVLYGSGGFWTFAENSGACIPLEWTLLGSGSLRISEYYGSANYVLPEPEFINCNTETIIIVKDRCGTEDRVVAAPCCETSDELEIVYTTLLMSCNQSQVLSVSGGCPPYRWSLDSGCGGIEPTIDGSQATYIAPATNPSCVCNPKITVIDCCNNSQSIELAVNCYTGDDPALGYTTEEHVSDCIYNYSWCSSAFFDPPRYYSTWYGSTERWNCAGSTVLFQENTCLRCADDASCTSFSSPYENICVSCGISASCPLGSCIVGVLQDCRTPAMKEAGCCPLNPLTGLPY